MSNARDFSRLAAALFGVAALALAAPARALDVGGTRTIVDGFFLADRSPSPPGDLAAWKPIRLPDPWSVTRPGTVGLGWYRFEWRLAEVPQAIQAIYLPGINAQAQVFVNGTLVGATGDLMGRTPESWERSQAFAIPVALPHAGVNSIAIRMQVPHDSLGGLAPIVVGDAPALRRIAFADLVVHTIGPALVSVTIVVLGLFILGLWLRRRDPTYALFAASAILWGAHTLLSQLPGSPLPDPHWAIWWHGVYIAFVCLLCLFCLSFTGVGWNRYRIVLIAYALLVVPALYAASFFGVLGTAAVWVRAGAIALVLVALVAVVRYAIRSQNTESVLLVVAGAVSAAFAVHDWLASTDPYDIREVWLVPYAALAFLVLVGWILVDRFVRALNEAERSNVELERRVDEKSAALAYQLARTQEARVAAETANRAKSRFLAAASHDLRQPLHALGLFAAKLPDHVHEDEGRTIVHRVRRSVESLEGLLSSLLDISKLDAGTIDAHPDAVALDGMFERLAGEFAPVALERGLKLAIVPTRRVVHTDPILLERIVRNLLDNALRHTSSGGVVVGARPRGRQVAIEVHDTGPGIAAAERERVFEEFYQLGNPERDRARGLGLGLAIVRRLSDLLGHRVEVDSTVGRGSVFRVIVDADDAANVAPDEAVAATTGTLAGRRVLVIDDEEDVREGTATVLASWGSECVTGATIDDALGAVGTRAPDAMIVDWRLAAGATGLDAIERVRAAFRLPIPAVIVSGASSPEDFARIKSSGFPLLHKPVAPARLRSALAFLLGAR